ncbi:MAG: hypothetical protein QXF25_02025 [Candidatus Pacearchaeota archaeon]
MEHGSGQPKIIFPETEECPRGWAYDNHIIPQTLENIQCDGCVCNRRGLYRVGNGMVECEFYKSLQERRNK